MGAAISAIEGWIWAGFGLPAAFRALWERVASLFRAAWDFFRSLVSSVRAYVSYERQTVRSNENEAGSSRFYANLGVNADQNQRESVEELLQMIDQGRRCYDKLECIVREYPQHQNLQEIEARLDSLMIEGQGFIEDAILRGLN